MRQDALVERRRLLAGLLGMSAVLGSVRMSGALELPPKETGLPFEGLLKGLPGFQPRKPAPLTWQSIPGFLSRQQMAQTYQVYRENFARLLASESALQTAAREPLNSTEYARLRRDQVMAANSVLLHEFYFRNLTPATLAPPRYVLANLEEHMGTQEVWRADFAACARIAGEWAALVYDPYDDRWHNVATSGVDAGGWVGANPLVVLNVSSRAYSIDYKDRDSYVAAFFGHIDWNEVARRYRAVDRH